jgi:hypothetical protein
MPSTVYRTRTHSHTYTHTYSHIHKRTHTNTHTHTHACAHARYKSPAIISMASALALLGLCCWRLLPSFSSSEPLQKRSEEKQGRRGRFDTIRGSSPALHICTHTHIHTSCWLLCCLHCHWHAPPQFCASAPAPAASGL